MEARQEVAKVLDDIIRHDTIGRIWRQDYTVWKSEPAEISDRLGWLTITDLMMERVPALQSFAREIRKSAFRQVVLLGMGGSSLGARVLQDVLGSATGYPELTVVDTTIPESVRAVASAVNPAETLFLVSSKSGTTREPFSLWRYFREQVAAVSDEAGQSFIAITDPETPLARLAEKEGFRACFLNPPNIGGRYSVLSYFGLVPAALMGVDILLLLERADSMRQRCAATVPAPENPGAYLGAFLGTLARQGRDKLTLVTSPALTSFGLWVEQLIAESTGKEGKGIVPVNGEPLVAPEYYGSDRLFVYLRLKSYANSELDERIGLIESSGQPVITLDMRDRYDLGAEFFRWEFATAVAGTILGVNPFNQPDVQGAKDATERLLSEYKVSGCLPESQTERGLTDWLIGARAPQYLAIMAYLHQTPEVDGAIAELRQKVTETCRIATTFGYGPRLLHSTGQLHKGGPDSGLFLQITASHQQDVAVPGEPYTFGVLADAQALGDLRALQSLGRRVVRVNLGQDHAAGIADLSRRLLP